jgi:hypothetical protein
MVLFTGRKKISRATFNSSRIADILLLLKSSFLSPCELFLQGGRHEKGMSRATFKIS